MIDFGGNFNKPKSVGNFIPIWCLNGKLTNEEIQNQIKEFRKKNITAVALKPEQGLFPPLNSSEYWEKLDFLCSAALENQLSLYLFEDLCFSSNPLLVNFTELIRDNQMPYLSFHNVMNLSESQTLKLSLDPSVKYIIACRIKNNEIEPATIKNLSSLLKKHQFYWKAPHGKWRIYMLSLRYNRKAVGGYQFNCLEGPVVKRYLDACLLPYMVNLKKWVRKLIRGLVVEAPNISPDASLRGVPWSQNLVNETVRTTHCDVFKIICALFLGTEKKTSYIRNVYYQTLLNLFGTQFIGPLQEFAAKQHVDLDLFLNDGDLFTGNNNIKFDYSPLFEKYCLAGLSHFQSFSDESVISSKIAGDIHQTCRAANPATILGRNRSGVSFSIRALKFEADKKALAGVSRFYVDGSYYHLTPATVFLPSLRRLPDLCVRPHGSLSERVHDFLAAEYGTLREPD